jgi:hypothetical protein
MVGGANETRRINRGDSESFQVIHVAATKQ